jgi:nitroimidazol reductase NimA-like FMN-containing flavoprotein (pyridoxamine 5'-phosphate oxidase superfamily)
MLPAGEACRWGIRYRSVMGTGAAEILEEPAAKRQALVRIMAQYTPGTFDVPDSAVARTVVLRVRVNSISGKQSER